MREERLNEVLVQMLPHLNNEQSERLRDVLNNVFCDCDYDISYGFVFADKYLQRHLKEIKTIIDIRNIRSNGVYTVKKNAEHPIKLTDYQESSISLTEQSKIDYALIINKYFEERRKYVSAIRCGIPIKLFFSFKYTYSGRKQSFI